jgi:hypothetical protein
MKNVSEDPDEAKIGSCDRCARRSKDLVFDNLSLRNLCPDCLKDLERRRMIHRFSTTRRQS